MNRNDLSPLVMMSAVLAAASTLPARQPNIVFILADDVGYGGVGCYGQEKYATPNIDRLAREGMRFTQHYASATCAPSRSALMTGLHTGRTAIRSLGGFKTLAASDVTMAEVLKEAGYATGIFGKWGMGYEEGNPGNPTRQGFDEFFGQLHHIHAHFYYPYYLWDGEERHRFPENEGRRRVTYSHDVIHARALDFIKRHRDGPFFLYLAYTLPHSEFTVPDDSMAPYQGRWPVVALPGQQAGYIDSPDSYAAFAGMMSRLDRGVGEVMTLLQQLGIDDDTLVVFTSDNGPQGAFWAQVTDFFKGAGPLRGYKNSFYEGGIRVPFIARWPGRIQAGSTSDLISACWDFMATAAELAEAKPPPNDGISMVPTLLGQGVQAQHEFLYWEYPQREMKRTVRWGDWKALQHRADGPFELYNLAEDLGETTDLAASRPDIIAKVRDCIARSGRTEPRDFPANPRPTINDFVK